MSRSIVVAVEGPDSDRALDEFLAIPGIIGEVGPGEEQEVTRDGGMLAAVGVIVGIVSGVASVVANIITWREQWKKQHEHQRFNAVIEDARGIRLSLNDATPEQITAVLKSLQA